jgi:hypothetical protein
VSRKRSAAVHSRRRRPDDWIYKRAADIDFMNAQRRAAREATQGNARTTAGTTDAKEDAVMPGEALGGAPKREDRR